MNDTGNSNYSLQTSYFSFWQVMAFILVFAFVGSWVLRTFAGAPDIKKFTISSQSVGQVEFIAQASKKPADDLVVTNTCHVTGSATSASNTSVFSDWTLDSKTGYTGRVSFNIPAKQKCNAYVHTAKNNLDLAHYNYLGL